MNYIEKIAQLRQEIHNQLTPFFSNKDCVLLDAPYHHNIGDVCIWEGEEKFLADVGACIKMRKSLFWTPRGDIPESTIIALHGGGSFCDSSRYAVNFRLNVIKKYPNNRIIIFPQSAWYTNMEVLASDIKAFSEHKDVWICARDSKSYHFIKNHFTANHVLLVPDMAFYTSDAIIENYRKKTATGRKLFLRRTDEELVNSTPKALGEHWETRDWPTFDYFRLDDWALFQSTRVKRVLTHLCPPASRLWENQMDKAAFKYFKSLFINIGFNFLSEFDEIATTRLHVMIMGTLLGKPILYMDNVTGKLSDFANTWLSDLDSVKPYRNDD